MLSLRLTASRLLRHRCFHTSKLVGCSAQITANDNVAAKLADLTPDTPVRLEPGSKTGEYKLIPIGEDEAIGAYVDGQVTAFMNSEDELEQQTLMEAIGLDSWMAKGPIMAAGVATLLSREWYVVNEETFVAACLFGFGWMTYVYAREPFGQWYDQGANEIMKAQNDAENAHIAACRTFLEASNSGDSIETDVKNAFADRMQLVGFEAKAKAAKERAAVKQDFERRLTQLVNMKAAEQAQQFAELLAEAKAFVYKESQSAAFKKEALAYAIQGLKDPSKLGEEPAGALYAKFMASKGMS